MLIFFPNFICPHGEINHLKHPRQPCMLSEGGLDADEPGIKPTTFLLGDNSAEHYTTMLPKT